MTLQELHSIPNFPQLFEDVRFKALITYLRANPDPMGNKMLGDATAVIRSEGAWQGWFAFAKAAEDLKQPPKAQQDPLPKTQPYTITSPPKPNA